MHSLTFVKELPLALKTKAELYVNHTRTWKNHSFYQSYDQIANNSMQDYKERIAYDANGNILSYLRHATADNSQLLEMDSLNYKYYPNTNRLRRVSDMVSDANYTVDVDNQTDDENYVYDPSGNLILDKAEGISIQWNVAGKVKKITKTDSEIHFIYDAMGSRIGKKVIDSEGNITATWYVLDAQGNQMATYEHQTDTEENETLKLSEWMLYGFSRLGVLRANKVLDENATTTTTFAYGRKHYELSNHLGNVLSTISDAKLAVDEGDDGNTDYFEAVVKTQQDYYPFGMLMPERQYTNLSDDYRFGFNGMEKDNEVKGQGKSYTTEFRQLDPRLGGRWWSIDPDRRHVPR
jgi:hypothetical protein